MLDTNQLLEMNKILEENIERLQQVIPKLSKKMSEVEERLGQVLQRNEALKGGIQSLQVMVENNRPDSVQGQGLQEVQADQNIGERILQELKEEEVLSALRGDQESMKSEPLASEQQEMLDTNQLLEMNKMLEEDIERLQQVIPKLSKKMSVVEERLGQVLQGNEALKGGIQSLQVMVENNRPDRVQGQGLQEALLHQCNGVK
ncbi:hypothetical protein GBF38_013049 [Nibea albiflora]|uniref:Uncharacterized protein n=1 Tax=Nibea albiflora TaxID=240163 RepID=A0ACB7EZ53_NIBAL|nr:hypothetical protein GBF38_013049 [Nibea albiflora]